MATTYRLPQQGTIIDGDRFDPTLVTVAWDDGHGVQELPIGVLEYLDGTPVTGDPEPDRDEERVRPRWVEFSRVFDRQIRRTIVVEKWNGCTRSRIQ